MCVPFGYKNSMDPDRKASYVTSRERSFYVSTILWSNELTGRAWFESGIRDLDIDGGRHEGFTLVQHDMSDGHAAVVACLKQGMEPVEIRHHLDGSFWANMQRQLGVAK